MCALSGVCRRWFGASNRLTADCVRRTWRIAGRLLGLPASDCALHLLADAHGARYDPSRGCCVSYADPEGRAAAPHGLWPPRSGEWKGAVGGTSRGEPVRHAYGFAASTGLRVERSASPLHQRSQERDHEDRGFRNQEMRALAEAGVLLCTV